MAEEKVVGVSVLVKLRRVHKKARLRLFWGWKPAFPGIREASPGWGDAWEVLTLVRGA